MPLIVFLSIFLACYEDEYKATLESNPNQIYWMIANMSEYGFDFVYALLNMCCMNSVLLKPFMLINACSMCIELAFTIWGCIVMFGEDYNKNMDWHFTGEGKPYYRGLFEAMVWLRLVPYMCCACVCVTICLLFPCFCLGNKKRQAQTMEGVKNAPIVGGLTTQALQL